MPASQAQQDTAARWGMYNVAEAAQAANKVNIPFHVACALLDMESDGENIYGHDKGGIFALKGGKNLRVTEANYKIFLERLKAGEGANGVGPCQVTYRTFFGDAAKQGLKLWQPYDNMLYGFALLKRHYKASGTWQGAGTRYNGKKSYGKTFNVKISEWNKRLAVSAVPPKFKSVTVKAGDTLSSIAKANHMTLENLVRINKQIVDPNKISVGETIRVA